MKLHLTSHKIVAGVLAASVALGAVSMVLAEDGHDIRVQGRGEIGGIRASSTIQVRGIKQDMKDLHASTTERMKEMRGEIKDIHASTTAAIKKIREEDREDLKEHHASTTIAIKARLDAKKQEAVMRVLKNRIAEEQRHINQLSKRTNELSTIALKIKAAGRNTAQAEGFLIDARAKLALASSTLATINVTASSTVASTTPGQKLNQFKTQFDAINDNLKTVHKDLAEAISSLKGIGKGIKFGGHGTSTVATSTHSTGTTTVTASTTTSTQ